MGARMRKLLKLAAGWMPGNGLRVALLRACGYRVGTDVYVGPGFLVADELPDNGHDVTIGNRVSIGPSVILVTSSSPNQSRLRSVTGHTKGPVVIEDDAWIGAGSILLPNIRVGAMSIVAAGAVVTEDIPPHSIFAGVPARVVKRIEGNVVA